MRYERSRYAPVPVTTDRTGSNRLIEPRLFSLNETQSNQMTPSSTGGIPSQTGYYLDMSGTSHFWFRSQREKVLGLGPGPFRNKFWCRSQSKIFWSRSRSKKTFWSWSCSEKILVLVLVKNNFGPGLGQKKKFGPGTGTTLPISSITQSVTMKNHSSMSRLEPQFD
jgi:hypothetical protein